MFATKIRAGIAVTALVASGLALAGPALADPSNQTTSFTPGAGDFVGVGSDTTQFVVKSIADVYNSGTTGRIASWDACTYTAGTTYPCAPGTTNITVRSDTVAGGTSSIARPNGSGAGKALLYGSGNNPSIDFARSSSGNSTAETAAGLVAYPYAVDYLVTVVSSSVTSNAPAALSIGQVLGIYNGTYTNWSQLGGANAPIHPFIPQTGSGTRSFFLAQLQNANGGVAPTLASNVVETQEHDPTAIKGDPDAIAPFSRGRAEISNSPTPVVRVENGWVAQRDVYNVVRSNAPTALTNLVGATGPFCSTATANLDAIQDNGFRQLASGVCGVGTQTSASTFTVNPAGLASGVPANQSSISGVSAGVRAYGSASNVVVSVANGGSGFVSINGRGFAASAPVNGTQASVAIPSNLPAGSYPITANYSGDATHLGSTGTGTLTVTRAGSAMSVRVKLTKAKKHKKATTYTATVRVVAAGVTPTGSVFVRKGSTVVGRGSLRNGVATVSIKIAKLKKGKNKLTVSYGGDGNVTGVVKAITVKRK